MTAVTLTDADREALFNAGDHHPEQCDCTGYAADSGYQEPEVCDGFIDTVAAVEAIVAARLAGVRALADEWDRDRNPHAAWLPIDFAAAVRATLDGQAPAPEEGRA